MSSIQVDVVSAEEMLFEGQATYVSLPGEIGDLGIKPGHTPLITKIKPGTVDIHLANGEAITIFVNGGVLEVQPNRVTVLSDTAIRASDLDEQKALAAKQAAEEAMKNRTSDSNLASMQAEFAAAAAQIAAIQKLRKRR